MVRDLMRWDPFGDLTDMHRRLDNVFGDMWAWQGMTKLPAMDVYTEDNKRLVAEVHAPGFTKDDIDIRVHEGMLEIKGKKEEKEEQKDKKRSYMMRQSSSSFYRRIALPDRADTGKIDAQFEDGLLKVIVPFKELPQPKKVQIKSGK
jgi:HSP20 family protein